MSGLHRRNVRETILVIDDDQRILQTFARNLKLAGHMVLTANTGTEGIHAYQTQQPDIVLVDVRMPHIDGFEVLRAIREFDAQAEVILITGHGDVDMAITALRAGASDFIPKPVEHTTLDAALQRAKERLHLRRQLREAQEALRASEEHYRAITETAFVGVAIISAHGELTFVNEAFAEMLGYSRAELVASNTPVPQYTTGGKRLAELTSPEEYARYLEMMSGDGTQLRHQYETALLHKDGTSQNVLLSLTPLHEEAGGGNLRTLAVISDITELKRAEAALQEERALLAQRVAERTAELRAANVELARAARLKDEFLANTSHELRTPLNAILGMSEILRRELYGPLNERQHKYVGTIEESGQHLLNLINDILDLSKIEAGKTTLQMSRFAAAEVCHDSLNLVQLGANKKRISITFTISAEDIVLNADKRRLKQILVNLLSNAVKFTPEGGQIGMDVVGDRAQECVRFTVWDTGIGIAPVDGQRLFRPFTQLDSSLSRQHEGTGLGLALVYRLAKMHGGSVSMESTVNQGSHFTVSLPWPDVVPASSVEDGAPSHPAPKQTPRPDEGNGRPPASGAVVLLAEDNESNIETFTGYLTASRHQVVVVKDGGEVLERALETRPDIIVMDIHLPGLDGVEAIDAIRAEKTLRSVPIIAVTALSMPGDCDQCLDAGANIFLNKPISLEELTRAVNTELEKRSDTL